jgi:DNA-binding HxlR family transcriptional regulator
LNHSSAKATEIYARFSNHDVRAALNAHGEAINDFMGDMSVVTRSTKEEQLQFKILERLSDGAKRQSLLRSVLYVRMDVLEQALCALEVAGKIKQRTEVINGRDSIFWRLIAPGEESTSLCTEMIRRHVPLVESRSRNSLTPEQRLEHRIIRALRVGINRQRSLYTSLKISSSELGTALTRMEKQGIVIRYTETGDNKRLCTCWRLAEKDEIGVAVDPANN